MTNLVLLASMATAAGVVAYFVTKRKLETPKTALTFPPPTPVVHNPILFSTMETAFKNYTEITTYRGIRLNKLVLTDIDAAFQMKAWSQDICTMKLRNQDIHSKFAKGLELMKGTKTTGNQTYIGGTQPDYNKTIMENTIRILNQTPSDQRYMSRYFAWSPPYIINIQDTSNDDPSNFTHFYNTNFKPNTQNQEYGEELLEYICQVCFGNSLIAKTPEGLQGSQSDLFKLFHEYANFQLHEPFQIPSKKSKIDHDECVDIFHAIANRKDGEVSRADVDKVKATSFIARMFLHHMTQLIPK